MVNQYPNQQSGMDIRTATNIGYLLVHGHATCLTVFLRHSFGSEALGINAVVGFVIMILFMAAYGETPGMRALLGYWMIAVIAQKAWSMAMSDRRGIHSRWGGTPWLGNLLTLGLSEVGARFMEAIACLVIGAGIGDPVLGRFVMIGCLTLLVKDNIESHVDRRRLRHMRDAEIEQRYLLERYRSGRF